MRGRCSGFRVEIRLENADMRAVRDRLAETRERFFHQLRFMAVGLDAYCRQLRAFLVLFLERGFLVRRSRDLLVTAPQRRAFCALLGLVGIYYDRQHNEADAGQGGPFGTARLPAGYEDGSAFRSTAHDNPLPELELLDITELENRMVDINNSRVGVLPGRGMDELLELRRHRQPHRIVLPPVPNANPHTPLEVAGESAAAAAAASPPPSGVTHPSRHATEHVARPANNADRLGQPQNAGVRSHLEPSSDDEIDDATRRSTIQVERAVADHAPHG